jgi:hypothetical protein
MSILGRMFVVASIVGLTLGGASGVAEARPEGYGPWRYLGSGVSVAFKSIGPGQTWMFRNEGPGRITSLEFEYRDRTGMREDLLPGSLKEGSAFGGWAAFLSTGRVTYMRITRIRRE